jgi:hypothetical protein
MLALTRNIKCVSEVLLTLSCFLLTFSLILHSVELGRHVYIPSWASDYMTGTLLQQERIQPFLLEKMTHSRH